MNLHVIETGFFKLDGGAMFGVVPKSIWQKSNPADENNMCTWAMRCLLIEDGSRLMLVDTGIGDKQDDKFFSFYYLHGNDTLLKSLKTAGFSPDDVTDVFFTHLHFDHCGGGVRYKDSSKSSFELVFKNANYWSNKEHWLWATEPNSREKASFLKENILPIKESGQLNFISSAESSPFGNIDVLYMNGHTNSQMLPRIKYKDKTIVFAADLIPSVAHIPLPYVMGYDTRPLLTLQEKEVFLKEAVANNYIIVFEHDPVNQCCTLKLTEKGIRADRVFTLAEVL